MTSVSRLAYAGRSLSAGRMQSVRRRPNRYVSRRRPRNDWERLHTTLGERHLARPQGLSLPLRILVTAALLGISFAIVSKEPGLHDQVAAAAEGVWDQARSWFANSEARPAVPARAPRTSYPATGGGFPGRSGARAAADFQPLALISDGGVFVLGVDGGVHAWNARMAARGLPVITGVKVWEEPVRMGVGLKSDLPPDLIRRIISMPFAVWLSEIHLGSPGDLILYTRDAIKIKLENGPHLARDLRRLEAVLEDIRVKHKAIAAIDMRFLNCIVVRPRDGR